MAANERNTCKRDTDVSTVAFTSIPSSGEHGNGAPGAVRAVRLPEAAVFVLGKDVARIPDGWDAPPSPGSSRDIASHQAINH